MSITTLPITPDAYRDFFKTLAENHKDIGHNDDGPVRFATVSDDMLAPWKVAELQEFLDNIKSRLNFGDEQNGRKLAMILLEPAYDLEEPKRGYREVIDGGFWLLSKPGIKNHDERRQVCDMAQRAAKDILKFFVDFDVANSTMMDIQDLKLDPIGPISVERLYGYKLEFTINVKSQLVMQANAFQGLTPTRVIPSHGPYSN